MKFYHYIIVILICVFISLVSSIFVKEGYVPVPGFMKKSVSVPGIAGKEREISALILGNSGLKLNLAGNEFSEKVSEGLIARQYPRQGVRIKSGATVEAWVSRGAAEITVPDLKGLTPEDASKILQESSLALAGTSSENSAEDPKGGVIRSVPPAGTPVRRNSAVSLVISSGEKLVVVPRVIGKAISQAQEILAKKGLILGTVKKETDIDRPFDVILRQYPNPGKKVRKGFSVTVVLNAESD
ncbi:MAG: PASTA domain-containing protein [bacterium]